METKNELVNQKENQKVEELAFLVVSKNQIGVTNSLSDIASVIVEDGSENEPISIWFGEKNLMLEYEYKIQLMDEVNKLTIPENFKNVKLVTPNFYTNYNRLNRSNNESKNIETCHSVLPVVLKHYK